MNRYQNLQARDFFYFCKMLNLYYEEKSFMYIKNDKNNHVILVRSRIELVPQKPSLEQSPNFCFLKVTGRRDPVPNRFVGLPA